MRITTAAALIFAAVALYVPAAGAQEFGKNKVQYDALDWAVLETPHVRLHYYTQEESLARPLAAFAESVCVEYDRRFRLEPKKHVPILLYSHHFLFQQTNASQGLISEGTGGLTELIKGRVLIPHNGSWARLRWVTRHELTHAYMLEKIQTVMHDHHRTQGYLPPLWFIEGLAEYCGTTWDADAEGLLRDAVTSGEAYPLTQSEPITGTVLMYKEGQSFLLKLAAEHGPDKVFDVLDNWWRAEDFETVFRMTYGMTVAQADEDWFESVRARYYPTVAELAKPDKLGPRLTHRGRFNLGPRVLPSATPGDTTLRFCYFNASENGIDLMLSEVGKDGRRKEDHLIHSGQSAKFESFHLFQSRPDASASGRIALVSKNGGRDALYVIDSKHRRVERRAEFPNLVAINDPSLSPGDSSVVFSAMDYGGVPDLYRVSWPDGKARLEQLTRDDYDDVEPCVSPDGRWVVFASDRGNIGGRFALFRLSLVTGAIDTLSAPPAGDDRQPVYSPDGKWIAFRSTRGGTSDLWVRPAEPSNDARRVTKLLGPAQDPDWLPGGKGLLYTAEHAITFQTYAVRFDPDTLVSQPEPALHHTEVLPQVAFRDGPRHYERQLGLDFVQNAVSVDPGLGAAGGGQVALSDVLGNEQIYFFLANDSQRFGNFWDGFEGGVTYYNQSRRLNWGVGLFRLTELYDADLDEVRREKRTGVSAMVSYPFDKFLRVSGSVLVRHATDHLLRDGNQQTVDLVSNFLTLTRDNSRWTMMGPSGGTRISLTGGVTRDLTSGAGDYVTLIGDARFYRQIAPSVIYVIRGVGQSSLGRDAQRFYLGGYGSIRGFDRHELSGLQTAMLQQEVRLPVLRGMTMAIPARWVFPTVNAAAFTDAAWTNDGFFQDRVGSAGFGVYVGGGPYPSFRWNYTWITRDFTEISRRPRTQFMISLDF